MPEGRACLGRSPIRGYGHVIPTALKVGRVARVCACKWGRRSSRRVGFLYASSLSFVIVGQIVGLVHFASHSSEMPSISSQNACCWDTCIARSSASTGRPRGDRFDHPVQRHLKRMSGSRF
jgi:hypothetical protein